MFRVIIPARYASSRLPGKPLLEINGLPMIQHVWSRAVDSGASEVVIATDDERVRSACAHFGAQVEMTDPEHASGTERIAEVVRRRGFAGREIVVNLQGDEPLIPAALISQAAEDLAAHADIAEVSTLCERIVDPDSIVNPNVVKVVTDQRGLALYFSRAPIPFDRDQAAGAGSSVDSSPGYFRHIGIYAYRVGYLSEYISLPASPLERLEKLEQLRILFHGGRIHVAEACEPPGPGVDTPDDLEAVRKLAAGQG